MTCETYTTANVQNTFIFFFRVKHVWLFLREMCVIKPVFLPLDYKETFSPTPNMTSVRSLMQLPANYDFDLHQMDVKTAYLYSPTDCEVYIEQREGFAVTIWNKMLHDQWKWFHTDPSRPLCVYNKLQKEG